MGVSETAVSVLLIAMFGMGIAVGRLTMTEKRIPFTYGWWLNVRHWWHRRRA